MQKEHNLCFSAAAVVSLGVRCDSATTKRVKVDLAEQVDTTPEMKDELNEYNDTSKYGYLISEYKDNTENDPDWEPHCRSDFTNKPATRKNSTKAPNFDGVNDNIDRGISDSSADSDSDTEEDTEVNKPNMFRCQSCDYRCRSQVVLRCHVMKKHHAEASCNGRHMCMECGQVEDTIEALQQHKEVGQLTLM